MDIQTMDRMTQLFWARGISEDRRDAWTVKGTVGTYPEYLDCQARAERCARDTEALDALIIDALC